MVGTPEGWDVVESEYEGGRERKWPGGRGARYVDVDIAEVLRDFVDGRTSRILELISNRDWWQGVFCGCMQKSRRYEWMSKECVCLCDASISMCLRSILLKSLEKV